MATKLILIVGLSVAVVIGMFLLGKFMDKGKHRGTFCEEGLIISA